MVRDSQRRAVAKYDRANTKMVTLKLNLNTDADIVSYLEGVDNVQGLIKRLLRREISPTYMGESVETIEFMYDYLRGRDLDLTGDYAQGFKDGVKASEQRIAEQIMRDYGAEFEIVDGEVPHETAWTTKPLASE